MRARLIAALVALVATTAACAAPTAPPPRQPQSAERPSGRPLDPQQAERLKRVMMPLIQAMNNPKPLNRVRGGILDDASINAASAGGGEFYVTRGLLEKASDEHLAGVLAHEVAHDDLKHVAKAQALGTGLSIGMIILDQIIPGSGAVTPVAGQLVARGYSRREEYAADRHGVEILQRTGRGKEVMIKTLTWLMETSGAGGGGFFATHPGTGDRIEALQELR